MDIIVTKRLTLRPPLDVDAEPMAELLNNANVSRMLGVVPFPYTIEDAREFIERPRSDDACRFTVHQTALLGLVGASETDGVWCYGYWFGEPYWGRGFASEAVPAVLAHLFARTGTERMTSYVFEDNAASMALQMRLGAKVVGCRDRPSLARGCDVPSVELVLERTAFERHEGRLAA